MNPLALLVAFMLMGDVRAIVELDCSDNATCIDHMAKELMRSLKQQKSVKVFNVLTIEPLRTRQARSKDWWLTNFLDSHAFSFDLSDYTFKVSRSDVSDALDLEIYEGRTAKGRMLQLLSKKYLNRINLNEKIKRINLRLQYYTF